MDRKILFPISGLIILICFFLPWIRACEVEITGLQLTTDEDVGEPIFWLIPAAGVLIIIAFFLKRQQAKLLAAVASIGGLLLLLWKIIVPFAKGEAREMGLSIQAGGIGTILGLLAALIGALNGASSSEEKNDPKENQ